VEFDTALAQIKALGSERVILATDLGQKTAPYPDEGLLEYATRLYNNGMSEKDIRMMTVDNPTALLA
jgi:hypothetical protein